MIIGVPREISNHEHRVGLTPFAAGRLTDEGHTVLIEKDAGAGAHFADADFRRVGAEIVYSADEAYMRADIVCRVEPLAPHELDRLKPGSIICGFHHLAVAPREVVQRLMDMKIDLIGYEIIEDSESDRPVLLPMGELAGRLSVHLAAYFLQNDLGGRGILLGNTPGVAPATVLVLGAGTVGRAAAARAKAIGAHVIVVDSDLGKLQRVYDHLNGDVVTVMAGQTRLEKFVVFTDAIIGAVLIPGGRSPFIITEDMVKSMKPGSVIIDVSIDQGGCVETSRPTQLDTPTFRMHEVIHYCVPNMTANIARTASRALSNASLPYLSLIAREGLSGALQADAGLRRGVYIYKGKLVKRIAAQGLELPAASLTQLLEGERQS